jgi:hypothetical protein
VTAASTIANDVSSEIHHFARLGFAAPAPVEGALALLSGRVTQAPTV